MSPVQTRSRTSSQVVAAATTMKEMALLKQTRKRSGVMNLNRGPVEYRPSPKASASRSAGSVSTGGSSSSVCAAAAAAAKRAGDSMGAHTHDIKEYVQRTERGSENVCKAKFSTSASNLINTSECVMSPLDWWDEESCSTPRAVEFRIPDAACLACPPAPRKRKAQRFDHMHPFSLPASAPLDVLPHFIDTFFLSAENPSFHYLETASHPRL